MFRPVQPACRQQEQPLLTLRERQRTAPAQFRNSVNDLSRREKPSSKNKESFSFRVDDIHRAGRGEPECGFFGLVSGQHPRYSALTSWPIFLSFPAISQSRVRSG